MDQGSEKEPIKITNPFRYVIYNAIGLVLVVLMHSVSPTNLAGPGLDFIFIIGYIVFTICMLGFTFDRIKGHKLLSYISLLLNILCFIISILFLMIPADMW